MNRKFKTLMVKNSTNINKTNNHLHSLNTKKPQHMILEIQILPLDRQINVMVLNWLMGSQPLRNTSLVYISKVKVMVRRIPYSC